MKVKNCDECSGHESTGELRQRIWEKHLIEKREIILNSEINDSVIELVVTQIQRINQEDDMLEGMKGFEREPIKLFINTNGGEIYSALAVCSAIEASRTPVYTIALGKAISAGFIILVCGHQRFAQRYTTLMHHTGSSGAVGTITDIIEEAEALEKLNEKIHGLIREHTSISDEQLDEVFFRKSNWYLEIAEALDLGVIDGIWGYPIPNEDEDERIHPDEIGDPCEDCMEDTCGDCEYYEND